MQNEINAFKENQNQVTFSKLLDSADFLRKKTGYYGLTYEGVYLAQNRYSLEELVAELEKHTKTYSSMGIDCAIEAIRRKLKFKQPSY